MQQRIKIRIRMRSQSRLTLKDRKIVMIGRKVAHLTTLSSKVVIRIALTLQNLIMAELLASRTLWELVLYKHNRMLLVQGSRLSKLSHTLKATT